MNPLFNVEGVAAPDSWQALIAGSAFVFSAILTLIPSAFILLAIFGSSKMRTTDNLIISQIVIVDVIYALWCLIWFPIKFWNNQNLLSYTMCQIEGMISTVCLMTWLFSATLCAFWRYQTIVSRKTWSPKFMILMQYGQWGIPFGVGLSIAILGKFNVMPSGGYCFLKYVPNDKIILGYFILTMLSISGPTFLTIFFYCSITGYFGKVIADMASVSSNHSSTGSIKLSKNGLQIDSSWIKVAQVALKSVLYCMIFLTCFIPFGWIMIQEMAEGQSRSPLSDTISVCLILVHKVLSPIVTIMVNSSIRDQIYRFLGIKD
jgi:hypothetical protein